MPIVIVKGSDGTKKKSLLKSSSSEQLLIDAAATSPNAAPNSSPTKRTYSNSFTSNQHSFNDKNNNHDSNMQEIVGDMTDILDFKLYRITKPNFYEPVSRTILVGGDLFYNKEELNKKLRTGDEEEIEKMPEIANTKPSVLQKIREMKYTGKKQNTVHRNQKDILTHVKAATERAKQVKSGHSLGAQLELPSAEMTVDWAVNYVAVNEAALVDLFIQFDATIKDFERQQQQALLASSSMRLAEAAAESGAANISESIPVPNTRTSPHRRDNNKNHTHGHAPGAPSAKPLSLATQLENLKLSGTESFVSHIIAPVAPSSAPPSSRRSVDISHLPPQFHRRNSKSKDSGGGPNDAHGLSTIAEPSNVNRSHAPPRKVPSSSSGAGSHNSHRVVRAGSHTAATASTAPVELSSLNEEDSSRPATAQDAAQALLLPGGACPPSQFTRSPRGRTRTSSNMDSLGDDDEDKEVDISSPRYPSPMKSGVIQAAKKRPKRKSSPTPRPPPPSHSRVYSNANVVTPQAPPGAMSATPAKQDTLAELMQTQKLFQQSMSYSTSVYESVTDKTRQLQEVIEAKLKKGNRGGQRIVKQWMSFRGIQSQDRQAVNETCQNKEFFRALDTLENLSCFQMDGYDRNDESTRLGVSAAKDLKYMRKNAVLNSQHKVMSRLLTAKWFTHIVAKTRDYMKRMNNNIPVCCLKFLTVFQYLLSYDYALTVELFYQALEACIVIKEDHIRNIVHVVVRAVRDALKISPQDFLVYLEGRNIQPCPELLNQIRALAAAQSQNQTRVHSPRSARHTPPQGDNRGGLLLADDEGLAFSFSGLTPRSAGGVIAVSDGLGLGPGLLVSVPEGVMEGVEPILVGVVPIDAISGIVSGVDKLTLETDL